ncbi:TraB/GumN family protein [Brevundimonas aurifodinae]|uniref:TraB/GumN family protein n=2 Tax=Brevundimonas TaxID=41275 RepID=A0ABV1NJF0_9CAUL|nr:MAG: polysaccharide biosynthesis protein GumN [Brevundimonas subvibrioides]
MRLRSLAALFALAAMSSGPVLAQQSEVDRVEDVIVIARQAQVPIWEVSRGDRSLILVGNIRGLPRDFEWSPTGLEAATERADRILYPPESRVSPADIIRLVWRGRSVATLPEGTTSADYLEPAVQARLEAVMADERNEGWRTRGFFLLGFELMNDKAGFRRGGRDAEDAVRAAARRARVPGEAVGFVRGDEIVDNLLTQPPGTYAPCVTAGVGAAEAGPEGFVFRAEDWRARRVPAVIDNPLDTALGQCWPWGDPEIGPQLRGQWLTALSAAIDQPGVTLAVAPLRLLAEPGGVLDGLEAEGFEIVGPEWRTD